MYNLAIEPMQQIYFHVCHFEKDLYILLKPSFGTQLSPDKMNGSFMLCSDSQCWNIYPCTRMGVLMTRFGFTIHLCVVSFYITGLYPLGFFPIYNAKRWCFWPPSKDGHCVHSVHQIALITNIPRGWKRWTLDVADIWVTVYLFIYTLGLQIHSSKELL